jgi:hypothetical protein
MATTYFDAEDYCNVNNGSFPLKISVVTGNGHGGGYLIFNDSNLIGPNAAAEIKTIDKAGQWITVSVTIKDKLEQTNWTSLTIYVGQHTFGPYKREVATHLDTVVYTIKIKIIKPGS